MSRYSDVQAWVSTPPWSTEYPDLVNLLNDNPEAPKYDVIKNNLVYGKKALMSIAGNAIPYFNTSASVSNNNETFSSTDFVSFSTQNFTLLTTSSVLKNGFAAIPFPSIGLLKTAHGAPTSPPSSSTIASPAGGSGPIQGSSSCLLPSLTFLLFIALFML